MSKLILPAGKLSATAATRAARVQGRGKPEVEKPLTTLSNRGPWAPGRLSRASAEIRPGAPWPCPCCTAVLSSRRREGCIPCRRPSFFFFFFGSCGSRWATIVPRWANIAPRWANIAPRWAHIAFKIGQHSPKMGQHRPPTIKISCVLLFYNFLLLPFFGSFATWVNMRST